MNREEVHKLLGGYATGILTAEEQRVLYEAALEDQELFDELAREDALRELLEDPLANRRLMEASEPRRRWFQRPLAWATAGSLAAALAGAVIVIRLASPPVAREQKVAMRAPVDQIAPAPRPAAAPPASQDAAPARVQPPAEQAAPERRRDTRTEAAPVETARKEEAEARPAARPQASAEPVQAAQPQKVAQPEKVAQAEKDKAVSPAVAQADQFAAAAPPRTAAPPPPPPAALGRAVQPAPLTAGFLASNAAVEAPLSYRIQRQAADGSFADLPAGAALEPSDNVRLSIRALESGVLTVTADAGGGRYDRLTTAALRVEAGNDYALGPWRFPDQRGEKRLVVTLTGSVPSAAKRAMALRQLRDEAAEKSRPPAGAAGGVVGGVPEAARPVIPSVTVTLPYQQYAR